MNRKRYINKIIAGGVISCLLLGACEQERFDMAPSTTLPEGQVIVDYAASEGMGTKAITDKQPKGVRINSLTYLLYNETGTLEKRREIPGLKEDGEEWPLARENMTWEQREALKDTLMLGTSYQVVFIANIDSAICGWKDAAGELASPLKKAETFAEAYLQMPAQPFNDRNMFYLFSTELNTDLLAADRNTPYSCPVMLQRVVTRQDFFGERLPEWIEQPVEGQTNPAEDYIHLFSQQLLIQFCIGDEKGALIGDATKQAMETFWDTKAKSFTEIKKRADDRIVAIELELPLILDPERKKQLEAEKAAKQAESTAMQGYAEQCTAIKGSIAAGTFHLKLFEADKTGLDKALLDACMQNSSLKTIFNQRWRDKSVVIAYNKNQEGDAGTAIGSGVDKFYLSNRNTSNGRDESVKMPVDMAIQSENKDYDGFAWVGFGMNSAEGSTVANSIQKLSFYDEIAVDQPLFELDAIGSTSNQTVNRHYQAFYTPINEIEYQPIKEQRDYTFVCNIDLFFDETPTPEQEALKAAITALLADETKEPGATYGPDITQLKLLVKIPDLSQPAALKIVPKWTVMPVTQ